MSNPLAVLLIIGSAAVLKGLSNYEVRRDGTVWSREPHRCRPQQMAAEPSTNGYLRARLTGDDGKRRAHYVHKLIAAAFLPPRPSALHQLRHWDGDKGNCAAENLLWGTPRENAADRARHGRNMLGEENGASKLTAEKVAEIRRLSCGGYGHRPLGGMFGVSHHTIGRIVKRETWKHV